jgi:serine/threonine protein kinase
VELKPDAVIAGTLRLLRPLGHGGMGVEWVSRHLRLDTDVAVKLIRPERAAANPALLRRFEREAKAAARIAHPNVVRVMDYGAIDEAVPYIVMELLQGFSLADLLEHGGRFSLGTAKSLARQMGSALESAHAQNIVHRDIKPHNVFVTEGSREHALVVKVLDFGVAKVLGGVPGGGPELTETGMVIGSAPYMSPEQLEGRSDVDLRSDLWSLGVVLYESLTGELPFSGGSFVTVGKAVLDGEYRPASELRPDLPPSIDDWFAKALCVDPDGRFETAAEMVDTFVDLAEPSVELPLVLPKPKDLELATTAAAPALSAETGDGVTATHAPAAKKPAEPSIEKRTPWRRIAALVAVVAAVGGGFAAAGMQSSGACPEGMVAIEGATLRMSERGETPRDVPVTSYCVDTTEVTVRAYAQCSDCEASRSVEREVGTIVGDHLYSQFCNGRDRPEHPINCVDFHNAAAYCESVGKRLPSEAEWELAARGQSGRTYPWGDEPPGKERVNACGIECSKELTPRLAKIGAAGIDPMHSGDDGAATTAKVGSYPSGGSPEGVHDLVGNVWEWTSSPYCAYGAAACDSSRRVTRGGGWDTRDPDALHTAKRAPSERNIRHHSIGFRCARDL